MASSAIHAMLLLSLPFAFASYNNTIYCNEMTSVIMDYPEFDTLSLMVYKRDVTLSEQNHHRETIVVNGITHQAQLSDFKDNCFPNRNETYKVRFFGRMFMTVGTTRGFKIFSHLQFAFSTDYCTYMCQQISRIESPDDMQYWYIQGGDSPIDIIAHGNVSSLSATPTNCTHMPRTKTCGADGKVDIAITNSNLNNLDDTSEASIDTFMIVEFISLSIYVILMIVLAVVFCVSKLKIQKQLQAIGSVRYSTIREEDPVYDESDYHSSSKANKHIP
nr:hypothetical protein MmNV_38 [Menippe mercenaria nudivirus]